MYQHTHTPRVKEGGGMAGGLSSGLLSGGVSGGVGIPPIVKDAEKVEESSLVALLWDGFLSCTCCFC